MTRFARREMAPCERQSMDHLIIAHVRGFLVRADCTNQRDVAHARSQGVVSINASRVGQSNDARTMI